MLNSIYRGLARAAGVETADHVRLVETSPSRPSVVKRLLGAFEQWNARRSTYLTLQQLDDRTLKDIGLHRGALLGVAEALGRRAAANDNARPVRLSDLAANDNDAPAAAECR